MKIRNKKTGEIEDWSFIVFKDISPNSKREQCFASISQLNEGWEDVKEPLIKDENTRKAVKAWAEANGGDCCHIVSDYRIVDGNGYSIEFYNDPFEGLEKRYYTIMELCGDD